MRTTRAEARADSIVFSIPSNLQARRRFVFARPPLPIVIIANPTRSLPVRVKSMIELNYQWRITTRSHIDDTRTTMREEEKMMGKLRPKHMYAEGERKRERERQPHLGKSSAQSQHILWVIFISHNPPTHLLDLPEHSRIFCLFSSPAVVCGNVVYVFLRTLSILATTTRVGLILLCRWEFNRINHTSLRRVAEVLQLRENLAHKFLCKLLIAFHSKIKHSDFYLGSHRSVSPPIVREEKVSRNRRKICMTRKCEIWES